LFPTNCTLVYRDKIPVNYSPFNEVFRLFPLCSYYFFTMGLMIGSYLMWPSLVDSSRFYHGHHKLQNWH